VELAGQINSAEGLADEPYFRAPFYPYFLSFVFGLTGESIYMTRLIQIILGSLLPVLIWVLGLKLFNRPIAYIAAGITAFYPTFIYFDSLLLITSSMVLLTTLLLWQLYRCQKRLDLKSFIFAGSLLGLAALARPNILLLGPALFVWVWLILRPKLGTKRAVCHYLVLGLACLRLLFQ
jgi:4-amino-4-deoxy-L-arabinose transferase-like glycosyltransferase